MACVVVLIQQSIILNENVINYPPKYAKIKNNENCIEIIIKDIIPF